MPKCITVSRKFADFAFGLAHFAFAQDSPDSFAISVVSLRDFALPLPFGFPTSSTAITFGSFTHFCSGIFAGTKCWWLMGEAAWRSNNKREVRSRIHYGV